MKKNRRHHVMIDIETLGKKPGAVILTIAACAFTDIRVGKKFYARIVPASAFSCGLTCDPETVRFWLENAAEFCALLTDADPPAESLAQSLNDFSRWIQDVNPSCVWACGASFDFPILSAAYDAMHKTKPWQHWQERCFRTVRNIFATPGIAIAAQVKRRRAHYAPDDVAYQANLLISIGKKYPLILAEPQ